MLATFPGPILVSGATGQQGGAVISALLSYPNPPTILALTRSVSSAGAQKLAAKSPVIKLVEGNLDHVSAAFEQARSQVEEPIWGVFSVQVPTGTEAGVDNEARQGKALIDESIKQGVKYFVYSGVDRGGNERSWDNPTNIPHFRSKHFVELHLRDSAKGTDMKWTILRPVAFTDNLVPGFGSRLFMSALRQSIGTKTLQWIATKDIGIFAARAFAASQSTNPKEAEIFTDKAISIAGDEQTVEETGKAFENATGTALYPAPWFLGTLMRFFLKEVRLMLDWFAAEGYASDITYLRSIHPELLTMEDWIKKESKWVTRE